jgi:hypothetical protein
MKTPAVRLVLGVALILAATSSAVPAAVLIVNNTLDSGSGSLRDTVAGASAGDKIEFNIPTTDPGYDPGTGVFTITLTTGEILVQSDLTISNTSGRKIALSGNQASRIFEIGAAVVAISDLSFVNGNAKGADGAPYTGAPGMPGVGGAVLNRGTLTVTRCTFRGNTAVGGAGCSGLPGAGAGGDGLGGAIANQNSLSLAACTLAANSAFGGPGGWVEFYPCYCIGAGNPGMGFGGAIHNAADSIASLSDCTITANSAIGHDFFVAPGNVFSWGGHGAAGQGGGIANLGDLTIVHCTVANNTAVGGASAPFQNPTGGQTTQNDGGPSFGGGVYCGSGSGATIGDTILAPNRAVGGPPTGPPALPGAGTGPDVNGAVTSQGHNLLGRSDGCSGFTPEDLQGGTSDDTRLDPMLGPLGAYGGPTDTLSLLAGSPAIDAGNPASVSRDQRYFERSGPPDIGAFEFQGTQPVLLANISTRLRVRPGDNTMIGGFIVTGTDPKTIAVRGLGPSLPLAGALPDPVIDLYSSSGDLLASNDDWRSDLSSQEIVGSGLQPANELESALWVTIDPGAYTVVVRGKNDAIGIGLFEVYDLDQTVESKLANISTRGFVETGNNVMIGGTIIVGSSPRILFRALGPSLSDFGVPQALGDPTLELYDGNGQTIATNDNWRDTQEQEILATGIPPSNDLESAIVWDLAPGPYTAIVRGQDNTTGVGLIEVYDLN